MRQRKRKKAAKRTMAAAILVIASLSLLIALTCSQVLVIRDIMVVGNRNLLREEVITQSGVEIGDSMMTVSSSILKKSLEQNRYIEYQYHEFDYRGTLTLHISERLGMAVVLDLGYYYVLDESGMVLEVAGSAYPTNVAGPRVTGFEIEPNSRIAVGEIIPVHDKRQLEAMETVIGKLEETNVIGRISELNVKNTENMYLITSEGAKVEIGGMDGLKTKLLIAREVLNLRKEAGDLLGAKIDVSNGMNAHYIPALLPTVTPVPTATPTYAPPATPEP